MLRLTAKREQYYVVYVLGGKVMSETKLYKKVYKSKKQYAQLSSI